MVSMVFLFKDYIIDFNMEAVYQPSYSVIRYIQFKFIISIPYSLLFILSLPSTKLNFAYWMQSKELVLNFSQAS
ncbi:hypothetical protein THERU_04550 [Thermocrinis ruber]|uniref:Uncharacterized protein n=1 Tax=Thermocrinis ruber TaxID=75906 RepID=W0DDY8_9AQUI|nr:hypothetical protein THERU_04550 [Thermocrinis ruber]